MLLNRLGDHFAETNRKNSPPFISRKRRNPEPATGRVRRAALPHEQQLGKDGLSRQAEEKDGDKTAG